MIHKKIGLDKTVHNLSSDTSRLAYTWAITHLDRDGRLHGDPELVKSLIFPRRSDVTVKQMEEFIQEWAECGLVVWYEAQGDTWLWFPTFSESQIGLRYDKEPPSFIPDPAEGRIIAGLKTEEGRKDAGKGTGEEKRRKEKRKEDKKPARHLHGDKVLLTDEEYQSLCDKHTKPVVDQYIEKVNDYCVAHGKPYTDYKRAIENYMRRDKDKGDPRAAPDEKKRASWDKVCPKCGEDYVGKVCECGFMEEGA